MTRNPSLRCTRNASWQVSSSGPAALQLMMLSELAYLAQQSNRTMHATATQPTRSASKSPNPALVL